jgi:DNA-binding XRE family transcriptional regulator
MIYFIKAGDKVKIGYGGEVHRRIESLQTASPERLTVLGIMQGEQADELALHARFAQYRLRGEWFTLSADIAAFVASTCHLPPQHHYRKERFHADDISALAGDESAAAVGKRLRALRCRFRTTQVDLADKSGIPQSCLSDYERGARLLSLPHAFMLRKLWAVSLDFLFFGEGALPEALAA